MSDYTVILAMLVTPNAHLILTDRWRQQVESPEGEAAILAMREKHHPDLLGIEDSPAGKVMIQHLQRQNVIVYALKPVTDKVNRATVATIMAEQGRIWVPQASDAPWLESFMHELMLFPFGAHDDQVDALAYGARWAAERGEITGESCGTYTAET